MIYLVDCGHPSTDKGSEKITGPSFEFPATKSCHNLMCLWSRDMLESTDWRMLIRGALSMTYREATIHVASSVGYREATTIVA